jgi:hypothetical protein
MPRARLLLAALVAGLVLAGPAVAVPPPWANAKPRPTTTTSTTSTSTTLVPTTTSSTTTTTLAPTTTTVLPTTTTVAPSNLPTISHYRNHPAESTLTWLQRYAAAEAAYGQFRRWRDFVPDGGSWPKSSHLAALDAGEGLFINVKPQASGGTWAQVAAGQRDSQIVAGFQQLAGRCDGTPATPAADAECWVTFHHEPISELGPPGFTAADYVAMQRHLDDLRDQYAPQVKMVWSMEGHDIGAGSVYPSLYPGPESVDVAGLDPYIDAGDPPAELAAKMVERTAWFRATFGLPIAFPEWGTDLNGTVSTRRPESERAAAVAGVHACMQELADLGLIDLSYFESRQHYFTATDGSSVDGQAYRALSDLLAP